MCRFALGNKFVQAASLFSYLDAVLRNVHVMDQL
jgi:hypothetical protein